MEKFTRPEFQIIHESPQKDHCIVKVEPLERGLGLTLGNTLRRVLISSVVGAAAQGIKLQSAKHEFTTIPKVVESVPNIILNVKKLVIKSVGIFDDKDNEVSIAKLEDVSGKVTAKNIQWPLGYSVINEDLHLFTVVEGAKISGEIYVSTGRGFSLFSKNKILLEKKPGLIAIDSNYSPVVNVKFHIEEKIGKLKDLEKLTLEVTTNGAIKASDAIAYASKVIIEHLNEFINWSANIQVSELMVDKKDDEIKTFLSANLSDLDLNVRSYNALKNSGIERIDQLCDLTIIDLQNIKNLGDKSIDEIIAKLKEKKLKLRQ